MLGEVPFTEFFHKFFYLIFLEASAVEAFSPNEAKSGENFSLKEN